MMHEFDYKLVYPQTRWVTTNDLLIGAVDEEFNSDAPHARDIVEAIAILEYLGKIEVSRHHGAGHALPDNMSDFCPDFIPNEHRMHE